MADRPHAHSQEKQQERDSGSGGVETPEHADGSKVESLFRGRKFRQMVTVAKNLDRTSLLALPVEALNRLIQAAAKEKEEAVALHILHAMEEGGEHVLGAYTYGLAISACSAGAAVEVLESMREREVVPSIVCYNSALTACSNEADADGARRVWRRLDEDGANQADELTFNLLVHTFCRANEAPDAFAMVQSMREAGFEPNRKTYNSLIAVCARSKRVDKAFEVFVEMKNAGISPDEVSFRALMWACRASGKLDLSLKVLGQMELAGFPAQEVPYNKMVEATAQNNQLKEATELYQRARKNGVRVSGRAMQALFACCVRLNQANAAYNTFLEMSAKQRAHEYVALLQLCAKNGQARRAQLVVDKARADKVPVTTEMYAQQIRANGRAGRVEEAFAIYETLQRQGERPDQSVFAALIDVCQNNGMEKRAVRLLDTMVEEHGLRPDLQTYNSVLRSTSGVGDLQQSIAFYEAMRGEGVEPNQETFEQLMFAAAVSGRVDMAEELLGEAAEVLGGRPNVRLMNTMIQAYALQGHMEACEVIAERVQGNHFTHRCLLLACAVCGDHERALELLDELTQAGYYVDLESSNYLIKSCVREGRLESAAMLFERCFQPLQSGTHPRHFVAQQHVAFSGLTQAALQHGGDGLTEVLALAHKWEASMGAESEAAAARRPRRGRGGASDATEGLRFAHTVVAQAVDEVQRVTKGERIRLGPVVGIDASSVDFSMSGVNRIGAGHLVGFKVVYDAPHDHQVRGLVESYAQELKRNADAMWGNTMEEMGLVVGKTMEEEGESEDQ